jgi:hypothetical protein
MYAQDDFTQVGRWAYGIQEEMYFMDQIGYISCGANLLVTDFSDPLNPVELNKITVDKFINHFILIDHYLYIADQKILWIYDVAKPDEPELINTLQMIKSVSQLYYNQDHLYQIGGDQMIIYNLAIRTDPTYLTTLDINAYVDDLTFYGNYIYCSTSDSNMDSLIVINRSDLQDLSITKVTVTNSGYVNTSALVGEHLYIGTQDSLFIMNLNDPSKPTKENTIFTNWVYDIFIFDTVAFITQQGNGLSLFDLSDPIAPSLISKIGYWASKAKFRYPYVYTLGNGGGPIYIHDLTDMANPGNDVGRLTFGDQNSALEVVGTMGYLSQTSKLVILDLSDPARIRQISSIPTNNCISIAVSEDYCYLAERWSGWSVVDISNPEEPLRVIRIDTDDRVEDIKIRGRHAYIADWGGGIRIYDISDPENPIELGQYVSERDFQRLILVDSFVYAFERNYGLKVIDITDKANPRAVDSIAYASFIETLIQHDTLVYLGMNGNNKILNINDPAHPYEYDLTHYWQAVEDFAISGETLYVAEQSRGLSLFDISSDPLNPTFISRYDHAYLTSKVETINELIYLLDRDAGIYVLRFDNTTSAEDLDKDQETPYKIFPIPSRDYLMLHSANPSKQTTIITIQNGQGQIVFSRTSTLEPAIQQIDLPDIPAGIYFLNIRNQNVNQTIKFIHIN